MRRDDKREKKDENMRGWLFVGGAAVKRNFSFFHHFREKRARVLRVIFRYITHNFNAE